MCYGAKRVRPSGLERESSPWKGEILTLYYGRTLTALLGAFFQTECWVVAQIRIARWASSLGLHHTFHMVKFVMTPA